MLTLRRLPRYPRPSIMVCVALPGTPACSSHRTPRQWPANIPAAAGSCAGRRHPGRCRRDRGRQPPSASRRSAPTTGTGPRLPRHRRFRCRMPHVPRPAPGFSQSRQQQPVHVRATIERYRLAPKIRNASAAEADRSERRCSMAVPLNILRHLKIYTEICLIARIRTISTPWQRTPASPTSGCLRIPLLERRTAGSGQP